MSSSTKLILRELEGLQKHPLPNIGVGILDDRVDTWIVNFAFDKSTEYDGAMIHLHLQFEKSFPSTAPDVTLQSRFDVHSHTMGNRICHSLIRDYRSYFTSTGVSATAFWNPSVTMRHFLAQLYDFLGHDYDRHRHYSDQEKQRAIQETVRYSCSCGHSGNAPAPEPSSSSHSVDIPDSEMASTSEETAEQRLLRECLQSLTCFVTQRVPNIPGDIVGFACNIEEAQTQGAVRLPVITTDMSPIFLPAFKEFAVSVSEYGNPMTHVLPFVVNDTHWKTAREAARGFFDSIAGLIKDAYSMTGPTASLKTKSAQYYETVLTVVGEIWKNLSVQLSKGTSHASERVLLGYCALHHLLLALCQDDRGLKAHCTKTVKEFLSDDVNRHKQATGDMGRFLVRFLLSDIKWSTAAFEVICELMARNYLWIKRYADDHNIRLDTLSPKQRQEISWASSKTGKRLLLLQVKFIMLFGHRTLQDYNTTMGRPSVEMMAIFQRETKEIQKVDTWEEFFMKAGRKDAPSVSDIAKFIKYGEVASGRKGYTGFRHKLLERVERNYKGLPSQQVSSGRYSESRQQLMVHQFMNIMISSEEETRAALEASNFDMNLAAGLLLDQRNPRSRIRTVIPRAPLGIGRPAGDAPPIVQAPVVQVPVEIVRAPLPIPVPVELTYRSQRVIEEAPADLPRAPITVIASPQPQQIRAQPVVVAPPSPPKPVVGSVPEPVAPVAVKPIELKGTFKWDIHSAERARAIQQGQGVVSSTYQLGGFEWRFILREESHLALTVQCRPNESGPAVSGVQARLTAKIVNPVTPSKSVSSEMDRWFNSRNTSATWHKLLYSGDVIRNRFCADDRLHLEIVFELDPPILVTK